MSTTETRVDATATVDRPSGPGGDPGDAPEEARTSHWRRAAAFGLPVALVGAFIGLGWTAEWFRQGLGWLAPHVATLLWVAVAAALGFSLIRRIVDRSSAPRRPRRFGFLSGPSALAGCVIAYLVELFGSWSNGGAAWWTVGGVVPFSDAMAYVGGAQRMLFDGQLDQFNSRRPLHATFLASEFAFTNFDLRTVLVIQAVLLGVASYLAARAIARDIGPLAGLALFAAIYGFARVGVQTASTETMGVTMGALALACLWSAIRRRNIWLAGRWHVPAHLRVELPAGTGPVAVDSAPRVRHGFCAARPGSTGGFSDCRWPRSSSGSRRTTSRSSRSTAKPTT